MAIETKWQRRAAAFYPIPGVGHTAAPARRPNAQIRAERLGIYYWFDVTELPEGDLPIGVIYLPGQEGGLAGVVISRTAKYSVESKGDVVKQLRSRTEERTLERSKNFMKD